MSKFYLTTPIYYPNARLHAGHAYTTLVCDALARYKRQCGYDVAFLTGTDEHGEKLERAAVAAGMTPQAFVAGKREEIKELWKLLEIEYTHFIYTDRADHTVSVQRMLERAERAGYVYKGHYQGRYCVHDERYLSEGTEPALCDICGRPGELISEDNYFFKLSAFQKPLLEFYDQNPEFVRPDFRFNEVKNFVKGGLRDISISRRRIKWGIPWPGDPEQVFYVWYDALTSYMTGIGYGKAEGGDETFRKYWPADVHMIGKDIIRFHAVYWPAFLMAADEPLPKHVVAHGWLLVGQDKMSKSKGNAVYVEPVAKFFKAETHGVVSGSDVLRYYVLREFAFGQDGAVSYHKMIERYNSDLANDLGNLANRTLMMISRYCDGRIPHHSGLTIPTDELILRGEARDAEPASGRFEGVVAGLALSNARLAKPNEALYLRDYFEQYEFSRGLERLWLLVSDANKYLNVNEPWALASSPSQPDRDRMSVVLYVAAESLRFLCVLMQPILTHATSLLWAQLGCEGNLKDQNPADLKWGGLKPGTRVGKPEIVFPRLDVTAAVEKLLALEASEQEIEKSAKKGKTIVAEQPEKKPAPAAAPAPSDKISIEDFAKVDMRVGEVASAEPVPGAQKLLKLMVDIGSEVRQVVAGIAGTYQPEQLVGMKVVVVTNLQPRKLRGVESNGMIVAASVGEEGKPVLVTFTEDVPKGARLK